LVCTGSTLDGVNLPTPTTAWNAAPLDRIDTNEEQRLANEYVPKLNNEQKVACARILRAVQRCHPHINIPDGLHNVCDDTTVERQFFLDGPGGTGKTFVYRTLMSILRAQGADPIAVAPTGIAAALLPGGRTAHSMFAFRIDIDETTTS